MTNQNYPFKYETHCHTSESSACSKSTAADMVNNYFKLGYSGLIITDHFFNGNTTVDPTLSWSNRVKAFCTGYENALIAAKDLDFDILFSFEYSYFGTDFLIYGLDQQFLLDYPTMLDWTPETFFDKVHEHGGFIVHAHPFRERSYISQIRLYPDYVDAVEVYNSGNDFESFNTKALEYAKTHNFIQTRGSDSHDATCLSGEGMYFANRIHANKDLLTALKSKNFLY